MDLARACKEQAVQRFLSSKGVKDVLDLDCDLKIPCGNGVLKGKFIVYDFDHYQVTGDYMHTYDMDDIEWFIHEAVQQFVDNAEYEEA